MANVTGTQTERDLDGISEKRFILRGTAHMVEGDNELVIQIPTDSEAPIGRTIRGKWKLRIREGGVGVLRWIKLTETQWTNMAESQWAQMVE